MPKICYLPKDFTSKHLAIIKDANKIVAEYEADGMDE